MTNNEAIRIINGWKEADIKEKYRCVAYLGEERASDILEMLDKQIEACVMAISALKATTSDPSHPFADDVMMEKDKTPIKYCMICARFKRSTPCVAEINYKRPSDYGICEFDHNIHTIGDEGCPSFYPR